MICGLLLAACGSQHAAAPDGGASDAPSGTDDDAQQAGAPDARVDDASIDGSLDAAPDGMANPDAEPTPDATPSTIVTMVCTPGGSMAGIGCGTSEQVTLPRSLQFWEWPDHGYRFDHWDDSCTGTARSCELPLDVTAPPTVGVSGHFQKQHVWSVPINDGSYSTAFGVAVAPNGDTLAVVTHNGWAELLCFNAVGVQRWQQGFSTSSRVLLHSVAVAADGTVMVGGQFGGTLDVGSGPMTASGEYDAFVATYDANGIPGWSSHWGGPIWDEALSIAPLDDGGAVVSGLFEGTMQIGGVSLTATGFSDGYAIRFDAAHNVVAASRFAGNDRGRVQTVVAQGDLIIAVTYSPEPRVVRLDASMNVVWSYPLMADAGDALSSTQSANVAVAADGTIFTTATNGWQSTVSHLGPDGALMSEKTFFALKLFALAVTPDGDLLLGGTAGTSADIGGGVIETSSGTGLMVARLGPAFEHRWSSSFANLFSYNNVSAIATDPSGGVHFAGTHYGIIDVGGSPLGVSQGRFDAVVGEFTP